jgi:creatinine amidohydrolase
VRRFYILNTGISTLRALKPAAELLAADGILMQYTDLQKLTGAVEKQLSKQEGGTHADEIETSMMLYIAPRSVDMKKAVKDYHPSKGRGLTRDPNNQEGTYSATGIWGDPTLATREKGKKIMEALVTGILKDLEELRRASLPAPSAKQD